MIHEALLHIGLLVVVGQTRRGSPAAHRPDLHRRLHHGWCPAWPGSRNRQTDERNRALPRHRNLRPFLPDRPRGNRHSRFHGDDARPFLHRRRRVGRHLRRRLDVGHVGLPRRRFRPQSRIHQGPLPRRHPVLVQSRHRRQGAVRQGTAQGAYRPEDIHGGDHRRDHQPCWWWGSPSASSITTTAWSAC